MPEGFRVASAWVSVSPDMEGFKEQLKAALDEAVAGVEAKARVTLDTSELEAKADAARARVDELDGVLAEPSIRLDDAGLGARADEARAKLDELDSKSARPDIGLESSELDAAVDHARERLDELGAKRAEPSVGLETAVFNAKLDAAEARLAAFDAQASTDGVFRDSQGRLRDSRGRFVGEGGGEGGGGVGGGGRFRAASPASGGAGFAVPGGFLGALTAGVTALLPGVGGAATGLGLLGGAGFLGLDGIFKAVSAQRQAAQAQGPTPQQQALTAFTNQVAVGQAQEQVGNARAQAAQDAITSARSIEQAQQNLASVERNAAEQQIQALESVRQAEQGVEEANYSLSEAQYNLNQAWESARENIRQLDDQLADSKLNVQSAQLAIQQALYQQKLVDQNAYSTSLDRQEAALQVARAQQQLTDAQDQLTDAQHKANQANSEGVDGSQQVIQAKQALTQAQYGQTNAQAQYADAQRQLTLNELNSAQQIRQAQQQLSAAQEQAAYQRMVDARNVADAQRNLTDLIKQQQLQAAATAAAENQAANQAAQAMARLTPAAQQVVQQILGIQDAFHGIAQAAENAIAPGLSALLQGVSKLMPNISSGISQMAGFLGQVFGDLGKKLQSPEGAQVLNGLIDNGIRFAQIVVPAVGDFVEALAEVGSKKGAVDGIANVIAGIADGMAAVAQAVGPFIGPLSSLLGTLGQALAPIGQLLGTVVGSLASALAPALQAMLPGIKALADGLGQGLSVALQAIGPLLQPVGEAFTIVVQALAPLLPTFGQLIAKVAEDLTPLLISLLPIIRQLAQLFAKDMQNGLIEVFDSILPLVPVIVRLVESLIPVISYGLKMIGVLMDIQNAIVGPVLQAISWLVAEIVGLASHWQDAVNWMERAAHWLWHNVFDPLWDGLKQGADGFIRSFESAWGRLEDVFKNPVSFLINVVYTKGIEALWNGVVDAIGQDSLKLPDIRGFAAGGVLPGYAPGRDTVPAMLSPGEGVLVPEAVQAIGPGTVLALNAAFGGGRTSTPGRFSGGGIVSWAEGLLGKGTDLAKIIAAVTTGNGTALDNALTKFVGTSAVGNYAKMLLGVPTTLIHDAVQAITGLFNPGGGSGRGVSVPGNPSGTVSSWFAQAIALTGAPAGWLSALETIGYYESGNNPNAENDWDINAKNGDPSRGIMQTIMSTFLGNHQAGTSMNIFDPVANIASAINYIRERYHDVSNVPGIKSLARGGSYVGYDSGGWLMPSGMPVNGLGKPEAVLTPDESQAFVAIVRQLTQPGGAAQGIGSKQVVVNFHGTQYPTAEQMAAIQREMGLALSGA